jgi:hypothetical protein
MFRSSTFCELILHSSVFVQMERVCTSKRYQTSLFVVLGRFLVILFLVLSSNRSIVAGARSFTQLLKLPPANARHLSIFFTSLSIRVASFSSSPSFLLANLRPRDRLSTVQPLNSFACSLPRQFPSHLLTPFASKALEVLVP